MFSVRHELNLYIKYRLILIFKGFRTSETVGGGIILHYVLLNIVTFF